MGSEDRVAAPCPSLAYREFVETDSNWIYSLRMGWVYVKSLSGFIQPPGYGMMKLAGFGLVTTILPGSSTMTITSGFTGRVG